MAGEFSNVQKKIVPQKGLAPEGSCLPHQVRLPPGWAVGREWAFVSGTEW